jgi:hypothetical protein
VVSVDYRIVQSVKRGVGAVSRGGIVAAGQMERTPR